MAAPFAAKLPGIPVAPAEAVSAAAPKWLDANFVQNKCKFNAAAAAAGSTVDVRRSGCGIGGGGVYIFGKFKSINTRASAHEHTHERFKRSATRGVIQNRTCHVCALVHGKSIRIR